MGKLTHNREAFCKAYIVHDNQSDAYRDAFSTENMKPETIHAEASRLMRVPEVAARIKELQAIVAKRAEKEFEITADTMLRHLDIIRKARIDDYVILTYPEYYTDQFDDEGNIIMAKSATPVVKFKDFMELTEEQLMAIEGVKETKYGIEVKLHGKEWSIEKINKHIGFYEKDNAQRSAEVVIYELPDNGRESTQS
jgi:phage terminase small subunit